MHAYVYLGACVYVHTYVHAVHIYMRHFVTSGMLYLVAYSGVEEYHKRLSCAMDSWSVLHML